MKTKILQRSYVGVEWGGGGPVQPWCIRFPFILFSILSSLILWRNHNCQAFDKKYLREIEAVFKNTSAYK